MPLNTILKKTLQRHGPLPLDQFMTLALQHPQYGYYQNEEAIGGKEQDFITAPEISQIFGELIAIWLIKLWKNMLGSPEKTNLVELGPGRGSLMATLLRIIQSKAPEFYESLDLYLVESNKTLRFLQKKKLSLAPTYITSLLELPNNPTLLIANEFLDALPIKAFIKKNGMLYEYCIHLNEKEAYQFTYQPSPLGAALNHNYPNLQENEILEYSPAIEHWITELAFLAKKNPSYALFIDYGYEATSKPKELTLQAIYRHRFISPFEHLGKADLSAYVNFSALQEHAKKNELNTTQILTQNIFLNSLGAKQRLQALKKNKAPPIQKELDKQFHILTSPTEMGERFKAITFYSKALPPPFNF